MNLYSIPGTIIDLLNEFTILVRKEAELARTEIAESMTRITAGIGMLVGGAVLLIPALVILLQAGVAVLENQGFASHWSALIVGGAALLVGVFLFVIGASQMKPRKLVPRKTIHQLQRDVSVAKNQVRTENGDIQRAA